MYGVFMDVRVEDTRLGQILRVRLNKGESFKAEPGALISVSGEFDLKSNLSGGLMSSALRMVGGGENLFLNEVVARSDGVLLEIGTSFPSEIIEIPLNGNELIMGDGVYLAHTGDIEISAKFGGFSSFSAGSGFMYLKASGNGKVYLAGGESVLVKELGEGEVFYLDNTSFLAVDASVSFEKKLVGKNLLSKLVGGEGIMFKFTGPAKVYYQTEAPSGLIKYLIKYLRRR